MFILLVANIYALKTHWMGSVTPIVDTCKLIHHLLVTDIPCLIRFTRAAFCLAWSVYLLLPSFVCVCVLIFPLKTASLCRNVAFWLIARAFKLDGPMK